MTDASVQDFLVPDLGEGLEDVTITEWHVAVGDDVVLNQTLCTVETNKARSRFPARTRAASQNSVASKGETLPVGPMLARIETVAGRSRPDR